MKEKWKKLEMRLPTNFSPHMVAAVAAEDVGLTDAANQKATHHMVAEEVHAAPAATDDLSQYNKPRGIHFFHLMGAP